jgi:phosphate transport system substrate-binding protein
MSTAPSSLKADRSRPAKRGTGTFRFADFAKRASPLWLLSLALSAGCSAATGSNEPIDTVRITGSDTMVNLAQAWVEEFNKSHPTISIPVKGGGSGVGIADLCAGSIEVATASRAMEPREIALAKSQTGKEPKQFIVGRDALAIYVSQRNPIETISVEQLAEIYGAGGTLTTWKQLNVDNAACPSDKIVRISRQNSSGTYAYFREAVLGKSRDYKQGYTAQSGSSDLVALVSKTPCAIGYSGMGYRRDGVKVLKLSRRTGEPGVEPTLDSVLDGSYPIARPLYLYTLGEPTGAVQQFIHWIQSAEGQKIVEAQGYIPLTAQPEVPRANVAARP